MVPSPLFIAALFIAIVPTTARFAIGEVRDYFSPGPGRHRRTSVRGRHAAQGVGR